MPPPARIGVYPETKHPSYFAALGLAMEAPLVATLARYGYRDADAPIWLQSFEVGNLSGSRALTKLRRVQLIEAQRRTLRLGWRRTIRAPTRTC